MKLVTAAIFAGAAAALKVKLSDSNECGEPYYTESCSGMEWRYPCDWNDYGYYYLVDGGEEYVTEE